MLKDGKVMKMFDKKIVFAAMVLLTAPSIVFASNFDNIKMIRLTANDNFISFLPFDGIGFNVSNFNQEKSLSSLTIQVDEGKYKLTFAAENKGQLIEGRKISLTTTIELKNQRNEEVNCDFSEEKILCSGGNLTLRIRGAGIRWSGETDSYTFEMDGGLLGFEKANITAYKSGKEVFKLELDNIKFSFSYLKNPDRKIAIFHLQGGKADWINEPLSKVVSTSNVKWNFENFNQTSNSGLGYVTNLAGFSGLISLNLQGTLTDGGNSYTVRNEIYLNLDNKHYSNCKIFEETGLSCEIRSGYIHTYIPNNKDSTLWKTFPKIFNLTISNGTATLTAGENSSDDFFKISGINIVDFKLQ